MKIQNKQIVLDHWMKVNIRFIIKEEDRKVIAIAKFTDPFKDKYLEENHKDDNYNDECIVMKKFDQECQAKGFSPKWNHSKFNRLLMAPRYIAVATCDPRDEWDEATGMKIAEDKIASKLLTAIVNRFAAAVDMLRSVVIIPGIRED